MKNAVIYARYSSDRQNEQSIEGQLRECSKFAEEHDIHIVDTYIDRAMTGTNDQRPDFQRMLADSEKPVPWDIVLIYAIDRFGRDSIEIALNKYKLKKNGKTLISATQRTSENIDGSKNLDGILLENIYIGMAEYYSAELSQKTKRGMHETRLKGNFIGGTPNYGYSVVNNKFVVNETEAPIVKEIFDSYAAGKSIIAIERSLNNRGITNRGFPFKHNSIYKLLGKEKYTGIYRVSGYVYDNVYPAIIPHNTYEIVRKRLDKNKHGKHVPDLSYLLRGKVLCGYCGKTLASYTGTSKSGKLNRYYKCRSGKTCNCKAIRKDPLEDIVIKTILSLLNGNDNITVLANKICELHNKRIQSNTPLHILEKELNKTNNALSNLLSVIENGLCTQSTIERVQELETKKSELLGRIEIEKQNTKKALNVEEVIEFLHNTVTETPQVMIDFLIAKVELFNDKVLIYLNYTQDSPPIKPNKNESLDGTIDSDRGFIFMEWDYIIEGNRNRRQYPDRTMHIQLII